MDPIYFSDGKSTPPSDVDVFHFLVRHYGRHTVGEALKKISEPSHNAGFIYTFFHGGGVHPQELSTQILNLETQKSVMLYPKYRA